MTPHPIPRRAAVTYVSPIASSADRLPMMVNVSREPWTTAADDHAGARRDALRFLRQTNPEMNHGWRIFPTIRQGMHVRGMIAEVVLSHLVRDGLAERQDIDGRPHWRAKR